jgi:hypothetical protein
MRLGYRSILDVDIYFACLYPRSKLHPTSEFLILKRIKVNSLLSKKFCEGEVYITLESNKEVVVIDVTRNMSMRITQEPLNGRAQEPEKREQGILSRTGSKLKTVQFFSLNKYGPWIYN